MEIRHIDGIVIMSVPGDTLRGVDLRHADLAGANLAGIDLSGPHRRPATKRRYA